MAINYHLPRHNFFGGLWAEVSLSTTLNYRTSSNIFYHIEILWKNQIPLFTKYNLIYAIMLGKALMKELRIIYNYLYHLWYGVILHQSGWFSFIVYIYIFSAANPLKKSSQCKNRKKNTKVKIANTKWRK